MTATDRLWDPITVGEIPLGNRLALAPMTRDRSTPGGVPTGLNAEYFAQRASTGLIITEGTQPSDDGRRYGLRHLRVSAPGMVDRVEMARMAGEALGRTVEAGELSPQEWASSSGMPEGPFREGLVRMMIHYDEHGFPVGNALVLRAILGREPRTLEQYFHELADERTGR